MLGWQSALSLTHFWQWIGQQVPCTPLKAFSGCTMVSFKLTKPGNIDSRWIFCICCNNHTSFLSPCVTWINWNAMSLLTRTWNVCMSPKWNLNCIRFGSRPILSMHLAYWKVVLRRNGLSNWITRSNQPTVFKLIEFHGRHLWYQSPVGKQQVIMIVRSTWYHSNYGCRSGIQPCCLAFHTMRILYIHPQT